MGDIYGSGAHGKEEMVIAVEKDGYQKPVGAEKAQTKWFISEVRTPIRSTPTFGY